MRLLLVTNMYPPHHLGGYELSCQDVVDRFRARGHDVTVLTTSFRRDGVNEGHEPPARIRRTLRFYWQDDELFVPGRRGILAIERHDQRELRAALRAVDPDVISVWNMGALPLSLIAGLIRSRRPLVYHVCNDWPELNLRHDAFRQLLERHPLLAPVAARLTGVPRALPDVGHSGTFCWVSRSTWQRAEAATPWRFEQSTIVHSGISHHDFPPVEAANDAKPWQGRLLYVGRIEGLKSVETIIEALPMLGDMTVDLVGPRDPSYFAGLMQLAEELGVADRITTSESPRPELRARYMAADAVLFTSKAEPFGLVPIEAMACGTPVVASGAGGSTEFLAHESNCLLYEAGDATALANAVRRLAAEPELRRSLASNGLATAAEFSVDRLADRLEVAHLAVASKRDGRRRRRRRRFRV
jgi:glycosyltransferase involved in cell wall biosynthesis